MEVFRMNFETGELVAHQLPKGAKLFCDNHFEIVPCCNCGKQMAYVSGYSSLEIRTEGGMPLLVCEKCADQEYVRFKEARAKRKDTCDET